MKNPRQLDQEANRRTTLDTLVRMILNDTAADQVFVGAYRPRSGHLDALLEYPESTPTVQRLLKETLANNPDQTLVLDKAGDYASALLVPFPLPDSQTGIFALFSGEAGVYQAEDSHRLSPALDLLRMALENHYFHALDARNRVLARMIGLASQSMMDYPSPQYLVNVLCEQLFNKHISTCAVLLYGPLREDRIQVNFDYLELTASWSRRYGYGIALGTKIYVPEQTPQLAALDAGETLLVRDNVDEFAARLDPFVRSLLRAERIRSLIITPLNAGPRRIGLLVVASNRPNVFTEQDMQICQTISEFIALSALTQLLQQERDLIEWGRAALLDSVTNGVVMVLPDAEGARVLAVNKVFSTLFGLSRSDAEGLMLFEMLDRMQIPQSLRKALRAQWLEVPVRDTERHGGEFHMIHSEGYPLDIEWHSGPVYQDERVMGRIFTFRDVTAERLAINLRSSFLSRISHELRTPLTSIHGFAQLILEAVEHDTPEPTRDYAERILAASQHLRDIFNDMIELSRVDAGEIDLTMAQGHLPQLIERVVAQRESQCVARGQQVLVAAEPELPPVMLDFSRITQVLGNILDNAIKFSPLESTIRVHTRAVHLPADLPPNAPPDVILPGLLVCVQDEGPGIGPDELDQIFAPFFRTSWAQQQQLGGTGLGLVVSRSIIELHRGKLWAEPSSPSRPGGYIVFSLPAAQPW